MTSMKSAINFPDGGELVVTREMIEVNYLSDLDADWRYTDAAGHEHHCEYRAANHYPTLVKVTDETYWCGECSDEHTRDHLECPGCGEHVRPGMTGPGTTYIEGGISATYNGEPASEELVAQLLAAYKERMNREQPAAKGRHRRKV